MNKFIAHRGNDEHKYKGNTLEAIIESLKKDYISGVEFDVRMTKDKKIVLIHNSSINHASDGTGYVKNMTLTQLRKYNFGTEENPAKISTLKEVLKCIDSTKKIVIDIKEDSDDFEEFIKNIYKIIKKYSNLDLYLCSFNQKLIKSFRKKYPKFKLGVILFTTLNIDNVDCYSDFLLIKYLSFKGIESDKEIMLWTVNNKDVYNVLKKDIKNNMSIITDKAYLLKEK